MAKATASTSARYTDARIEPFRLSLCRLRSSYTSNWPLWKLFQYYWRTDRQTTDRLLTDGQKQSLNPASAYARGVTTIEVLECLHVSETPSWMLDCDHVNLLFLQEGWTALFFSVYNGRVAIAQVLLSAGADPNLPTEVGCSGIMLWHRICRWLHVWVTNDVHEIVVSIYEESAEPLS